MVTVNGKCVTISSSSDGAASLLVRAETDYETDYEKMYFCRAQIGVPGRMPNVVLE